LACSKRDAPIELIQALIQAHPPALCLKRGKNGETPLHMAALKGHSLETLQLLLRAHFSLIDDWDLGGYTVVERLWRKLVHVGHRHYVEQRVCMKNKGVELENYFPTLESFLPQLTLQILLSKDDPLYNPDLLKWWTSLSYLLKVKHYRTVEDPHEEGSDGGGWNVLHAALGLSDSLYTDLVQCVMLMELHHSQFSCEDTTNGNVLFTLAENAMLSSQALNSVGDPPEDRNLNVLLRLLTCSTKLARERNADGELPLHVALKNGVGWEDGIQALVNAYPDSLTISIQDPSNPLDQMLPFMISAQYSTLSLDTLFELLLASPSVLADCISH